MRDDKLESDSARIELLCFPRSSRLKPHASRLSDDGYVKQLTRLAKAYANAEADVIAAFFKKPRKPMDHLRWLKAQGFKEYSAIKPIIDALTALYPKIDRGIDRHDYAELTEKLADETKHARLVMDLVQEISGKKDRAAGSHLAAGGPQARQGPRQVLQELCHTVAWFGQSELQRDEAQR